MDDAMMSKANEFAIEVKLKNFENLAKKNQKLTQEFSDPLGHTHWSLRLYPSGINEENKNYLSVFLHLLSQGPVRVNYSVSVMNTRGGKYRVFESQSKIYTDSNYAWGLSKFMLREEIVNNRDILMPNGDLAVLFEIKIEEMPPGSKYPINKPRLGSELFQADNHDLTLMVDGKEIKAHRIVLEAVSPVFAAMFAHDTKERETGRVEIEDTKSEVINLLLQHVYDFRLNLNCESLDTLELLIHAADKYQITSLRELCIRHLLMRLKPKTAARLLKLADQLHLESLYVEVLQVIKSDLQSVVLSPDWIEQENEMFRKALSFLVIADSEIDSVDSK